MARSVFGLVFGKAAVFNEFQSCACCQKRGIESESAASRCQKEFYVGKTLCDCGKDERAYFGRLTGNKSCACMHVACDECLQLAIFLIKGFFVRLLL